MSEGNPKGEKLEEYVEALQDYQYEHHGQTFIISKGEIFLVLKSTNNIWWQVIRAGSKRAFYAPAQHLQRKSLSEEEMKRIISGHNSSSENVSFQRRSQEFDGGGPCLAQELSPNSTHATSQGLRSYPGHFQTSPLHISKSSLNEGSAESLRHQPIKPFIKSRSIDELRSGGRSHSTLDITKMREASSEELDRRASGGIQLSPRLRSSSFDLRMPPKDTEMKQGSLDKPRNSRISKDQGDRRRSWALENFRPSLKRGETVDAAIVLDVPPELPPKTRPKRGLSTFSSNPENVGHLEGPIDLKVEQARMAKSGQLSLGKEQHAGREAERRHSRHSSDPLLLLEENTSYPLYQESQNGKGPPIALPRKLLPPQTCLMESRPEVQPHIGDYSHRDANGNKVKEISSQSSIASISYATHEGSVKTREFLGSFRQKSKASEPPLGKSSGTPEMIIKNDTNLAPPQKCRPESPKTQTVKSKFSQGFGSFRNKSKRETKKEEREEPPTRETPTPDSSRGGKIVQSPPSPRCPPQRTLNGDWGEYIEEVSKRPYYYNSVTREKRWKPPRWSKGNTSNSISEVPSTGTDDRNFKGNAPQCPPKCPTPDYPTSPRLSHKPFSYTCNPDTTPIHSTHPRVAAHNSSSTSTPHSNTSQTLTNTTSATRSMSPPQISGKKLLPLSFATPPAVPPSSAKPTFPTTPTTPEFADFTAATTTDDQNYALLDILYKMKLPRGWEKKYDAFNQRIYFLNVVTRERPRGVSCVSELDVGHLNDKQYMRKSYQSNMNVSKELQLDTNVLEDGQSVPNNEITPSEQKIPPPKPPRAFTFTPEAVVIVPNRSQQMKGQSRGLIPQTDQASILAAGSRVSSFSPMSSFSKPRGHSRSKSESLKSNYAASSNLDTQELIPVVVESTLDVQRETSLSSSRGLDLTISKSLSVRSKSPSSKTSLSPQTCKSPVPSSRASHVREDIREMTCTLPRLVIGEKGMITGNILGNPREKSAHTSLSSSENVTDDSKHASEAEIEGVSQDSMKQYSNIVQELTTRSLKPSKSLLPTPNVEEEQGSKAVIVKEQDSEKKSSDTEAFLLDTPFTLSKMSRLNQSRKAKQASGERLRRCSGDNLLEPRNQIRNSSFVSHDEDGSILEDKPLLKLSQMAARDGVSIFQRGWPLELVVPPSLLSSSESNDSPRNDDSEVMSPTCNFSFDGQEYKSFEDHDKWLATSSDEGKVYYYEESGTKSAWRLPEVDEAELPDQEGCPSQPLASPSENYRLSNITENLSELSDRTLREGFLHRTFLMRDSKKVRKNWTHSYTRYIVHSFNNGCSGILYFTKNKDDEKRSEIFEFFSPCYLEHASDKKTSRQLVFGLRNGHDTEVLLHFEDKDIAQLWLKDLKTHEGIEYCANTEKEDKKGKKGSEKIKRETSVEQLSPDSKGIKDKLRNFIRRRPMKETLENKGIYKESVFGSTLAELKSQDKTNIPIFVLLCIQNIEKDEENLKTDGLYRISGNAAQIQKIRFEVAQRKHNVLSQEKEIHNLSGALKLFFRELKEPLIPYEIYDDFIRATGSEYRRMNQQADKLMKAVNKLPVENRDTLKLLMQHLLRVSEYESENRMSLSNLAIVFGPCLMWPKVTVSHDLMTDVMLHNRVVEGLLCDFDKIFSKR